MSDEQTKTTTTTPQSNTTPSTAPATGNAPTRPFRRPRKRHKPTCKMCKWGFMYADYKDYEYLRKAYLKNNKIITHKITGNCMKHQHQIATAIKRARIVALLPFVED